MPSKKKNTKPAPQKAGAAAAAATGGIAGFLSGIYNRLPLFPFLDRSTSAILYCCMAAFLLFTIYVMAQPAKTDFSFTLTEGALHKNAQLSLLPGENYSYTLGHEGDRLQLSYQIRKVWGCKGVVLSGNGSDEGQYCILQNGNVESDPMQYNSSLGNSTGILFAPWMLAASEDFNWRVTGNYWNGYFRMRSTTNFTSLGKTRALGREAFAIRAASDTYSQPTDYYVDAEKRVLLFVRSGNTTAWLDSAPFALDLGSIPEKQ